MFIKKVPKDQVRIKPFCIQYKVYGLADGPKSKEPKIWNRQDKNRIEEKAKQWWIMK